MRGERGEVRGEEGTAGGRGEVRVEEGTAGGRGEGRRGREREREEVR